MWDWLSGKRYQYENTRQYMRLPASWPVKYEATPAVVGNPQLASMRDVSAGGVAVVAPQMIPVGSQIRIEIRVPPLGRSIQARARVVRCLPMREGGFDLGIQFLEIDPKDRKEMDEAIKKSVPPGWRTSHRRSWWRKVR